MPQHPLPLKIGIFKVTECPQCSIALSHTGITFSQVMSTSAHLCHWTTGVLPFDFTVMILWQVSHPKHLFLTLNMGELEPGPDYNASLGPGERLFEGINYQDLMRVYS